MARIIDVQDYGADPTGDSDSRAAFQNAFNANLNIGGNRALLGVIAIRRGDYKVTGPVFMPPGRGVAKILGYNQIRIIGEGATTTRIFGNVPGFILDSSSYVQATAAISNGSGGSGDILNVASIDVGDSTFAVGTQIATLADPTTVIATITALGSGTGTTGTYTVTPSQNLASTSIIATTSAASAFGYSVEDISVENTNSTANSSGCIRASGMLGFNAVRVAVSGMVGFTSEEKPGWNFGGAQNYNYHMCYHSGGVGARGFVLNGDSHTLVSCNASGCEVGVSMHGSGHGIIGGHFEVNTTALAVGQFGDGTAGTQNSFTVLGGSYEGNGTGIDLVNCGYGFLQGQDIHGESNKIIGGIPGQTSAYGLRARDSKARRVTIIGGKGHGDFSVAGFYFGEATSFGRAGNSATAIEYDGSIGGGGSKFVFPTGANTAPGWTFHGCSEHPLWTYSQLDSSVALEGDRFYITDGNQASVGSPVTAGGGANRSWVTWDGTNWQRGV